MNFVYGIYSLCIVFGIWVGMVSMATIL